MLAEYFGYLQRIYALLCMWWICILISFFLILTVSGVAASAHSCRCSTNPHSYIPHPYNVLALTWKNFVRIYRNLGLLLFQFILPSLQVSLFCFAIGGSLKGIKTTYVNQDNILGINLSKICNHTGPHQPGLLNISSLGELYINKLLADPTFDMVCIILSLSLSSCLTFYTEIAFQYNIVLFEIWEEGVGIILPLTSC